MVPLKDFFSGYKKPDNPNMTSSQKCIRTIDIDIIGDTDRHLSFFEMLGNFSVGKYFKKEAIEWAWELVVERWGFPADRLYATVYMPSEGDPGHFDQEAYDFWAALFEGKGLDPKRQIVNGNVKDNFWMMGETGPCGPCSELHVDLTPNGDTDGKLVNMDSDLCIEIWNLVFIQYNAEADGSFRDLPAKHVDTGMGFERAVSIYQGTDGFKDFSKKPTNYATDAFQPIFRKLEELCGKTYHDIYPESVDADKSALTPELKEAIAFRVIADHIRTLSFSLADGILLGNTGRNYVLRRILRRAVRYGRTLGFSGNKPFLPELVDTLVDQLQAVFPELKKRQQAIKENLLREEASFNETLDRGLAKFEEKVAEGGKALDGAFAFQLYDTFGFPADLTADVARERGLGIDQAGFEAAMEAQRERARAASRFGVDLRAGAQLDLATEFGGYTGTAGESTVIALLCEGELVEALRPGERGEVILARTPFYAESGGQVGDAGELQGSAGSRFIVEDTQKRGTAGAHSHIGRLAEGGSGLKVGDTVSAQVDTVLRGATALNHSATHLLHAALREVLGSHVQQKGSRVAPDRLRFDFAHFEAVSSEQLQRIERRVNEQIRGNATAETREMSYDEAVAEGAMALFGEKYGSSVRVLRIGDFSMELCGGTHVGRAGDIGLFKVIAESGVAAGVRRIEAVTGEGALRLVEAQESAVREVAGLLRGTRDEIAQKVRDALDRIRQLEKENRQLRDKLASGQGTDLAASAVEVAGLQVVATQVDGADANALRTAVDQLKDRLKQAVIVLASVTAEGKVVLVAGVTAGETSRIKAGEIVGHVASQVGGRGGGRPDFAQAGGTDAAKLPEALGGVVIFVRQKLGG